MRPMCWRARNALALAVAPVTIVAWPGFSFAASKPTLYTGLIQAKAVHPNPAVGQNLIAYPLNSPPINGFTPQVVLGLTDAYDNNDFTFSSHTANTWVGNTLPKFQTQRYSTAILDSGSSSHLITLHDWEDTFDLPGASRDGTYEATLQGAGPETEDVLINDAQGVYVTGFGGATVTGGNTIHAPAGSFKGHWNTSILSTEVGPPDSILPNIIGSPMISQYQAQIRNRQARSLTVNGETLNTPQVDLTDLNPKVPGGYTKVPLTMQAPGFGVTTPPSYFPSLDDVNKLGDNPVAPTQWGALMTTTVSGSDSGMSFPAGTDHKFLMDTGAQVTVLSELTASEVGFYKGSPEITPPEFYVDVGGVGGVVDQVPGFYMDSLTITAAGSPAITWTHVPVIVLDLIDPGDADGFIPGILGMNLFTDRDLIVNGGTASYLGIGPQYREWGNANGGNWSDSTKWMEALVPNGIDQPAVFRSAISAARTVNVDGNYTVGSMTFDSANSYTLAGAGRITLQTTIGTSQNTRLTVPASVWVGAGSHTISAPMTFASDVTLDFDTPASMLTISSDVTAGTQAITKTGPGTLQMKNVRAGALSVNAGKLTVLQNGGQSGTSKVSSLAIGNGARLDLKDNDLVIAGGDVAGIAAQIQSGRNGGAWDGSTGIVTSMTAATSSPYTTLAISTASDAKGIAATATTTWSGQTVSGSDVLVMYTYGGDANLDGTLNVLDYVKIDQGVHTGLSGYSNGDFNYDGVVNILDYVIIDTNIPIQGASLLSASGDASGVVAIPEPAGLAVLGLIFCGMKRRRRPS